MLRFALLLLLTPLLTACNPILSLQGAFWPPWILAMVAGSIVTAWVSIWMVREELIDHIGSPLVFFPIFWINTVMVIWLVCFTLWWT